MGTPTIGSQVVHPQHGTATVRDTVQRTIGSRTLDMAVLEVADNDLTVMVPVDQLEDMGLRPVMDQATVDQVWATLQEPPTERGDQAWTRWQADLERRAADDDPVVVATVVRDLLAKLHGQRNRSLTEVRLLSDTTRQLAVEIAAACNRDPADVEADITATGPADSAVA